MLPQETEGTESGFRRKIPRPDTDMQTLNLRTQETGGTCVNFLPDTLCHTAKRRCCTMPGTCNGHAKDQRSYHVVRFCSIPLPWNSIASISIYTAVYYTAAVHAVSRAVEEGAAAVCVTTRDRRYRKRFPTQIPVTVMQTLNLRAQETGGTGYSVVLHRRTFTESAIWPEQSDTSRRPVCGFSLVLWFLENDHIQPRLWDVKNCSAGTSILFQQLFQQ